MFLLVSTCLLVNFGLGLYEGCRGKKNTTKQNTIPSQITNLNCIDLRYLYFHAWGGRFLLSPHSSIVIQRFFILGGISHFLLLYRWGRLPVLCYASAPFSNLPFMAGLFLPIQTGKSLQGCGVARSGDVHYFCPSQRYFYKFWGNSFIKSSKQPSALSPSITLNCKIEVVRYLILNGYWKKHSLFITYRAIASNREPGLAVLSLWIMQTAPVGR